MVFQPDIPLPYYKQQGINDPEVYVESYVALNGRLSQKYIDSK
jgi:hypothetical protein